MQFLIDCTSSLQRVIWSFFLQTGHIWSSRSVPRCVFRSSKVYIVFNYFIPDIPFLYVFIYFLRFTLALWSTSLYVVTTAKVLNSPSPGRCRAQKGGHTNVRAECSVLYDTTLGAIHKHMILGAIR